MNVIAEELAKTFEEVEPMDFYREIFPEGELDEWREHPEERTEHKYTGILLEFTKEFKADGKQKIKRYTVTDELDAIDNAIWCDNFCAMSPVSYIGKTRRSENARVMYALTVELDNLIVTADGKQDGLHRLINQWSERVYWIPRPTFLVASGNGVHLYYVFERGIPLFPNVVQSLKNYKTELTKMIWNRHTTTDYEVSKIQFESIFQPFRVVGTVTKSGDRTRAFRTGERVSIEYMNRFILDDVRKNHPEVLIKEIYTSRLTLAQAREKYPEWYEKRIVQGLEKGSWVCKRDLYDWWKEKIINGAVVGHRYYCMMMLCVYAIKCNIPRDELESDCLELAVLFEQRTDSEDNHFTQKDVLDALQAFEDKNLVTVPLETISHRSGIPIERKKRNGRKQADHIVLMNTMKNLKKQLGEEIAEGRPSKKDIVLDWRISHPNGRKADCIRETGLTKPTVYKWWNCVEQSNPFSP